jgi:hypothetical protein
MDYYLKYFRFTHKAWLDEPSLSKLSHLFKAGMEWEQGTI